jgi:NADP-dependent 3-hydroxy acid dehydrogenase YdfG
MSKIKNSTILITGADGGIGSALLQEFVRQGAGKIYAAGLTLSKLQLLADAYPGIVFPLVLDVTKEDEITSAIELCSDINMLINNAGVEFKSGFLGENAAQKALFEMKVNYIGVVSLINGFLPTLIRNSESYIINILSVGSTAVVKRLGTYCASKSATHILTQSIREELKDKNVNVIGVYPGYVNTEMSDDVTVEKASPEDIAANICNGIENGEEDIFPDSMSKALYEKRPISITFLK